MNGVYLLLGVLAGGGMAFLGWLRWLVVVLVIYAAVLMLMSARVPAGSQTSTPTRADLLQSHDA